VSVCGQIVYSSGAGMWELRLRRARRCAIFLVPDQFATPGQWESLTASQSVAAQPDGAGTEIILRARRVSH